MRTAVVYLLIFVLAGFVGNLWMSRNQASGSAPVISAQDLKGNWHDIAQGQFDGPVLLYFFADWCPICKVQHAAIRSISEHYPVLAIAMQSGDSDNVRQYVEQAELDMPVINDIDGSISRRYGVNGVPASFVVAEDGAIRFSTRGYATQLGLLGRLWLTEQGLL